MRRVLALLQWGLALALLPGLYQLDAWLSVHRTLGPERNAVRGGLQRTAKRSYASGLVVLGSSTSADWLPMHWLPRVFHLPPRQVVDGHVNGCHQGCTWAEVRRLLWQGRHFQVALFGTNQFQMCEHEHSKRVLQHRELAPPGQWWPDVETYLYAQRPLRWIARYALGELSGAYADTSAVQKRFGEPVLGNAWKRRHLRFVRPHDGAAPRVFCPYGDDDVAYKRELSRRLYADLARLADDVYILLLPDRTLAEGDPAVEAAWERHRRLQAELVAEHPRVHLLDLTAGQAYAADDFSDAIHLQRRMRGRQRTRFVSLLREAGVP